MGFTRTSLRSGRSGFSKRGFTIVELLTVVGMIAILIALLIPALSSARRAAQATQCASNLRQLTIAMINYSVEFDGYFPPNVGLKKMFWYNNDAVGRHIGSRGRGVNGNSEGVDQHIGGVFVCPADLEGAVRSYSMNTFASGTASPSVIASTEATPPRGKLFKSGVKDSSHMILLIEAFSVEDWPAEDPNPTGWSAPALVGYVPPPVGRRFGAGGKVYQSDLPRYGAIAAQICYFRHRAPRQPGTLGDALGRLNIAFADGHVALHAHDELYDKATGKSTFLAMWSPVDRAIP
ncbi:MAG: hypothetical protein QOE14_211 [Humisphaera sp.]|nr:hypothetical protein [Humisphaera sp.]